MLMSSKLGDITLKNAYKQMRVLPQIMKIGSSTSRDPQNSESYLYFWLELKKKAQIRYESFINVFM